VNTGELLRMLESDMPLDYATARSLHNRLVRSLVVARDSALMRYDPMRAEACRRCVAQLDGLEIYAALSDGDLARRLWAGRAFENASPSVRQLVGRLLVQRQVNDHVAAQWAAAADAFGL
jgi:hypothetical protein